MRVLWSSNARVIVRDAEVWPIFGRKYELSRVSRADKSRYFGLRGKETKETEREYVRVRVKKREGEREGREGSVVTSLVKADLLCEFLISVHLPVVPTTQSCAHMLPSYTSIRVCTYLREENERGRAKQKKAYFHFKPFKR